MANLSTRARAAERKVVTASYIGAGVFKKFDPADLRLRWAPPALINPVTLAVPIGFYQSPIQADDQDLIIQMPASMRNVNSDMEIRGGRNIIIIGGHARGRIQVKDFTGNLHIEGLEIDMTGAPNKDALNAYGKNGFKPNVTFQNCRFYGAQGTNAGTHADLYQPQGPIGKLRIDRFSGDSNYQGFFLRPEFFIDSADISRSNIAFNDLGTPENNTYLYWFRNTLGDTAPADQSLIYPVRLTEVYASAHEARSPAQAAAYPPPGEPTQGEPSAAAYAGVLDGSGNMVWPAGSQITGSVKIGTPAGGDFVTAAQAGLGYVPATEFQGV